MTDRTQEVNSIPFIGVGAQYLPPIHAADEERRRGLTQTPSYSVSPWNEEIA